MHAQMSSPNNTSHTHTHTHRTQCHISHTYTHTHSHTYIRPPHTSVSGSVHPCVAHTLTRACVFFSVTLYNGKALLPLVLNSGFYAHITDMMVHQLAIF